ncbi:MAG: 30S ribosomal protein S20 [Candidatus Falkowbacteria bacterium]
MPNKKSAKKELRKSTKKEIANTFVTKQIKELSKESRKALLAKDEKAKEVVAKTMKALDKAAAKGIIKKTTAARKKSRLHKKLNSVK